MKANKSKINIKLALDSAIKKLSCTNKKTERDKRKNDIIFDAEILLAHALRMSPHPRADEPKRNIGIMTKKLNLDPNKNRVDDRAWLYGHPEYELTPARVKIFKNYIYRRAKGEPIAYITHHKEFYGLDFLVNKNVLIPRPETELMVESVIEQIKKLSALKLSNFKLILIDAGTGSGCIPIAIIKNLKSNQQSPITDCYAFDISVLALRVAQKNAVSHGLNNRIKFFRGNLLEPIIKQFNNETIGEWNNWNIILTANLPYLSQKIYRENHAILKFEPKRALLAKKNGLALYEKLIKQIKKFSTFNFQLSIFFEIDPQQTKAITKLIKKYLPRAITEIKKDLAGRNRLVVSNIQF